MQRRRLVAFLALSAGLASIGQPAAATDAAGFPDYSREEVARVCLSEYGMGNASVIDCLAQDQTVRGALSRRWADIDESYRKDCLGRLADRDLKSYAHLDLCVRSAEKEARAPADE